MINPWQDIENALKNGTHVLVRGSAPHIQGASGTMVARYKNGRWLSWPGDFAVAPTRWAPIPDDGNGT